MKTIKMTGYALAVALTVGTFIGCSSDDDNNNTTLPPIGGYNSSAEVGAADLVAYWPMNGSGVESKSNTSPSDVVNTAFVTGIKGQAASMSAGYMEYPSIPALATTTGSMTISTWAKVSNNKTLLTASTSCLLTLTRDGDWAGNMNLLLETAQREASNDSIQVKGLVQIKKPDGTNNGQDIVNMIKQETWMDATHSWNPNKVGGKWAHYVIVWNGSEGTFKIWVNGVEISNNAWESRNGGDSLPLNFFTPTRPIIGALSTFVDGTTLDNWNKPLTGQVDEMRVWKKALSSGDINALYQLEKAGR
jgi:hypothetical protein